MKLWNVLLNSVAFTIGWTGVAHADPITTAIFGAAFAASTAGALVSLTISTAISIGAGLLINALKPKPAASPTPGTQLSLSVGGNVPISFMSGYSGTAGSLVYPGTWGNSGQTENAYYTQVICISDLPCALTGMWWNDQKITLPDMTGTRPTAQGWPIAEGNDGTNDNLWVFVLDGSQTSADSFLSSKFGSHPTRPFSSDMIGAGQTIVVVTALYNRNLFVSDPSFFFETSGVNWYNPAKDSSVGGSGSHRWSDPTTWEPSSNPVVQIYNLRRGVFYGSQWVFGGNNKAALDPYRLPVANWIAGINACDTLITNADSSTEPAYRAGGEITGDMQPVDVIDTLLQSCNGRMAEIGGVYKIQVNIPGSAVYSFTDADVVITDGQTFDPFPGLENTNNAIEATYPEPAEKWATKPAPGLYSSTLEAEDGGRRLVASVQFPMVPYALQVQRLNQALILDSRRFRSHQITLPPDAWALEPGVDIVAWTSDANGYSSKLFLVTAITGQRGFNQVVALKEVEPADYDWNASTDQQSYSTGTLTTIRPAAQVLSGWTATQATFVDNSGRDRRPSIAVGYDGAQVDVRAVLVTAREKNSGNVEWSGELDYQKFPTGGVIPHAFLPNVTYQVQGDYIPYSGRAHTPSSWLDVTTEAIYTNLLDVAGDVSDLLTALGSGLRSALADIEDLQAGVIAQDLAGYNARQSLLTTITTTTGKIKAAYENAILVATGPSSGIVEDITSLKVALGGDSAGVNVRFSTGFTPATGWDAKAGIETRVDTSGTFHAAGIYFESTATQSRAILVGSEVVLAKDDGSSLAVFNGNGEYIGNLIANTIKSQDGTSVVFDLGASPSLTFTS